MKYEVASTRAGSPSINTGSSGLVYYLSNACDFKALAQRKHDCFQMDTKDYICMCNQYITYNYVFIHGNCHRPMKPKRSSNCLESCLESFVSLKMPNVIHLLPCELWTRPNKSSNMTKSFFEVLCEPEEVIGLGSLNF